MPSFHEVLFPDDISYGSSGGPAFNTTIIELASGHEQRNVNWSEQKARYDASHGIKVREQMEVLLDFFYARNGKAYGFRYKDWADFELVAEPIGLGNGVLTTYQIFKRYEKDTSYFYDRVIRKIVPGTLKVFKDAVLQNSGVSVDNNTGIVTFTTPPANGVIITVTGEFHVPVRFDTDEMAVTQDDWETMSWPTIPLVEIKPRS